MSDLLRIGLRGDFVGRLRAILPGVTDSDIVAFDWLVVGDRLVTDAGAAHPDLLEWVQRILDRDAGGVVPVPVRPVPRTGPAGVGVAL